MRTLSWAALALFAACGIEVAEPLGEGAESRATALYEAPAVARWTNGLVPVCFTGPAPGAEQAWAKDALAKSWAAVANVGFVYSNSCPFPGRPAHVQFTFDAITDNWGSRGVADIGMRTPSGVVAAVCAPTNPHGCLANQPMAADYEESFRAVVVHEFGHLLGFVHEQQRPDSLATCPLAVGDQSATVHGGVLLTAAYDPDSIMNYCRGWDGVSPQAYQLGYRAAERLSVGDIAGVRAAYGARRMTAVATPSTVRSAPPQTFTVWATDTFGAPVGAASVFVNGVRLGGVGQLLAAPTKATSVCRWVPGTCEFGLCTKPRKECEPVTTIVPFTAEVRANHFDAVSVPIAVIP